MRTLFFGDVVGRSGRDAVARYLPLLKERYKAELILLNGENAASGFGINEKIAQTFWELGVDCITTGNHAFDQRQSLALYERSKRIIRPINYPKGTPGAGMTAFETALGQRVVVINAMGRLFMDALDDPFAAINQALLPLQLGKHIQAIFVDFHAEATSEKLAAAHYFDGRISCLVGTHTHVPTADARILKGGTAYITDLGMCGDYDSVIGMEKEAPIKRFTTKMPTSRLTPALGEGSVSGVFIETDDKTGHALRIELFYEGAMLR